MVNADQPNALTRRSTVRELVAEFQRAEATVRECFLCLVEAERDLNLAFCTGNMREISIEPCEHGTSNFKDAEGCIERMRRHAWSIIVERLEMRRAMSIARWNELETQLRTGELPPITDANVTAFAERYMGSLPAMLREAIAEVFEWLRPPGSEYKTNSELEVGERVILPSTVEQWRWLGKKYHIKHHSQQRLVALENVFNSLAGNGQIAKQYQSALQTAIEASQDGTGETDLFAFRACKNGNLHLRVKRLDLLAAFNAAAGGKRLRQTG
jgi:hypothetical protein